MKRIELTPIQHSVKVGQECPAHEPNVTEDCILCENGEPFGFYMKRMPEKMCKLADIANKEFNSSRVPKKLMRRASAIMKAYEESGTHASEDTIAQYSTILGSVPPKYHMRRPYGQRSVIHNSKTAQTFIKAMLMLANESETLIKQVLPGQHKRQADIFEQVADKWKFGRLWTGSISNCNISAPFHRDTGNIVGAVNVNVIVTKRLNAKGGNLHVPEYGATIDSADNSVLVYPAWKNIHGVTPIEPTYEGGYRNSLIFYPIKAFIGLKK